MQFPEDADTYPAGQEEAGDALCAGRFLAFFAAQHQIMAELAGQTGGVEAEPGSQAG